MGVREVCAADEITTATLDYTVRVEWLGLDGAPKVNHTMFVSWSPYGSRALCLDDSFPAPQLSSRHSPEDQGIAHLLRSPSLIAVTLVLPLLILIFLPQVISLLARVARLKKCPSDVCISDSDDYVTEVYASDLHASDFYAAKFYLGDTPPVPPRRKYQYRRVYSRSEPRDSRETVEDEVYEDLYASEYDEQEAPGDYCEESLDMTEILVRDTDVNDPKRDKTVHLLDDFKISGPNGTHEDKKHQLLKEVNLECRGNDSD
ncbi:hypothetical protein J437_LFUL005506, partial [Ladona fulva]